MTVRKPSAPPLESVLGARVRRRRGADRRRRARRTTALHRGHAARGAERQPLRPDAERRHGLEPGAAAGARVRHREHDGRAARRGRHADRARLSHRALGDRPARARSGARRCARAGAVPVRGVLQRPVRRPHAGHDRDVRQPRLPQRRGDRDAPADPLAADGVRA